MTNYLILNGHQPYPFSEGKLNKTLVDKADVLLRNAGHATRIRATADAYDTEAAIADHQWADVIILQFPVNWMGVPWSFKKYMDDVYTAGMDGRLTLGDGRSEDAPKANYGMGGALGGKKYMISATFNAPAEAFDDPAEPFFEGKSVDDLLLPVHLNMKFFGVSPLPTFAAFDVMKNPDIDADFARFENHIRHHLMEEQNDVAA